MGRDSLGDFEQLVLLAALRLGSDAYVVPIIDDIANRTGRDVTHAAVYVALRRLEKRGLVSSRLGESTPERGGKPKRYFEVAPEALVQLRDSRDALLSMWKGLEPVSR